MRKNTRWSGMGVNGLRMGALGSSMGLRTVQMHAKDLNTKEVCLYNLNRIFARIYYIFF